MPDPQKICEIIKPCYTKLTILGVTFYTPIDNEYLGERGKKRTVVTRELGNSLQEGMPGQKNCW